MLVGRDSELAAGRLLIDELADGRGAALWIEGEAGIGKTELLGRLLAHAGERGCRVLHAAADEALSVFPLWVLFEGLRSGTGERLPQLAASVGVDVAAGDVVDLIDKLCMSGPVVLAIDDIQWADAMTLAVWARLRRAARQMPLLVIAAARTGPGTDPLAALRDAAGPGELMTLPVLGEGAVAELVEALAGTPAADDLLAWAQQAGGNPLYVIELVQALVREGALAPRDGVVGLSAVPADDVRTVGGALAHRLAALPAEVLHVLRLAAILGNGCTPDELAAVAGIGPQALAKPLAEAVAAAVLQHSGDRLAFRHELLRRELLAAVPAGAQVALHRHAAQVLSTIGASMERVAEHLLADPSPADAWTVRWLVANSRPLAFRAPDAAETLVRRVLPVMGESTDREVLESVLVAALHRYGRFADVVALAAPILPRVVDDQAAGQITWSLMVSMCQGGQLAEAYDLGLRAVTERRLSPLWTARLLAVRSIILTDLGRYAEADVQSTEAFAAGEAIGDPVTMGYALQARCFVLMQTGGGLEAELVVTDQALAVVENQPEAAEIRLALLGNRINILVHLARWEECDRATGIAVAAAEEFGGPSKLARMRVAVAERSFHNGRWDVALAELEAIEEDQVVVSAQLHAMYVSIAALMAYHRDDRVTLAARRADLVGFEFSDPRFVYAAQYLLVADALAVEAAGDLPEALRRLTFALYPQNPETAEIYEDGYLWLPLLVRWSREHGDDAGADRANEAIRSHAEHAGAPGPRAAAQHGGGLHADDPQAIHSAAKMYADAGLPLYRGHALEDAAVAYARRGDMTPAREAFLAAVAIYLDIGASRDVLRADARLRSWGIRRGHGGQRSRPTMGWEALSPTETKVASLVAAGMSNPDIAAELYLSRRTVQTHVSHILTKLDLRSRVDVAREVRTRQAAGL